MSSTARLEGVVAAPRTHAESAARQSGRGTAAPRDREPDRQRRRSHGRRDASRHHSHHALHAAHATPSKSPSPTAATASRPRTRTNSSCRISRPKIAAPAWAWPSPAASSPSINGTDPRRRQSSRRARASSFDSPPAEAAAPRPSARNPRNPDACPHSILIVDDEAGIRHSLSSLLREEGYAVDGPSVPARNASNAVDRRHVRPGSCSTSGCPTWTASKRSSACDSRRPLPHGRDDLRTRQYRNRRSRHQARRFRLHREAALPRKNHPRSLKTPSISCAWKKKIAGCARNSDSATR